MSDFIFKSHEEIVEEILIDFANELGVDNISNASDIAIKSKVYAAQIEGIYYNQAFILKQSNPMTATDSYLDMWGKGMNIGDRKDATRAIGAVIFGRKQPSQEDIVIPEGTMFSTNPEVYGKLINGVTTEKVILPAGETEIEVLGETIETGEESNVPPGVFSIINNPPVGIEYVKNIEGFKDGSGSEEDEEYRSRFKKDKFYGTDDAFANRAREVDGVVFAKTLEMNRGRGTTDVLIAAANGIPSDELVERALKHLLEKRPLGCDLGVIKPEAYIFNTAIKVSLKEGFTLESKIEDMTILERIKQSIRVYIKVVGIGGIIRKMGLANAIYDLEEVIDVEVIEPIENIQLNENAIAQEGEFNVTT
ncbi:baseplate J/gp47 family protein [Tissierella sp. MB52-C2]|uniref:baseplate J/gp47 family protein n=1 Tax=Tissierella sp. MB52-C2 TaxID=3070999 RepID=UPI00280BAA20|nr:baseplate J/gp47 family protein [Tissierella sp. MB52-C2]WMM26652.1 baseplate J/gp47 family protein [Tissierella sp. MB52-C2]